MNRGAASNVDFKDGFCFLVDTYGSEEQTEFPVMGSSLR